MYPSRRWLKPEEPQPTCHARKKRAASRGVGETSARRTGEPAGALSSSLRLTASGRADAGELLRRPTSASARSCGFSTRPTRKRSGARPELRREQQHRIVGGVEGCATEQPVSLTQKKSPIPYAKEREMASIQARHDHSCEQGRPWTPYAAALDACTCPRAPQYHRPTPQHALRDF